MRPYPRTTRCATLLAPVLWISVVALPSAALADVAVDLLRANNARGRENRADDILESLDVPEYERDSFAAADLLEDEIRQSAAGDAETRGTPPPAAGPQQQTPWARAMLPRFTIALSRTVAPPRQETQVMAFADFFLGRATGVTWNPPPPPARDVPHSRMLIPALETPCLVSARNRAVGLAFADPARARSMITRARRAAWLPQLSVRVDRRVGRYESIDFKTGGGDLGRPLGLDIQNSLRYEARATWDLSKVVFSAEELAAEAHALRMADMRRTVEAQFNRVLFERRRLKADANESAPAEQPANRRRLRVDELGAELDSLSGGAFSACGDEVAGP